MSAWLTFSLTFTMQIKSENVWKIYDKRFSFANTTNNILLLFFFT